MRSALILPCVIGLVLVLYLFGNSAFAQTDTTAKVDKVFLRDGTSHEGKVKMVRTDIVEFVENETDLNYEFKKSDIKIILLSNGKTLSFPDSQERSSEPKERQQAPPVYVEKDDGAPVGLIILASVGAVLLVLLLIGAAAQ